MDMNTYQLLDSGGFRKLEQVGPFRFVRPSPQAVWKPRRPESEWKQADAEYVRFSGGQGEWRVRNKKLPEHWHITVSGIPFVMRLTDFGHLGIFPEQGPNWISLQSIVRKGAQAGKDFNVLNLFAYTGGSTLAAAVAGAKCVHVDASKTSVAWARENADRTGQELPVRWIVEDVRKFVSREVRRGSKYQGIILDPPSFGRGAKGEVWKIEEHMVELLSELRQILADDYRFVLLSSHSDGYTPVALRNLLSDMVADEKGVHYEFGEMLVSEEAGRELPSGSYCFLRR